ncbi:uncharacterized protein CMC5_051510 [Chondromyces crocatus]|uniref:Uncharacterized protein n=1 Tax=Chondromyces crocatus TaxID=52 RepID=A0A0K1EJF6_CHOCO|nr:uncharacterized protein CMC5_051510 [Chondromyces crocatus]
MPLVLEGPGMPRVPAPARGRGPLQAFGRARLPGATSAATTMILRRAMPKIPARTSDGTRMWSTMSAAQCVSIAACVAAPAWHPGPEAPGRLQPPGRRLEMSKKCRSVG